MLPLLNMLKGPPPTKSHLLQMQRCLNGKIPCISSTTMLQISLHNPDSKLDGIPKLAEEQNNAGKGDFACITHWRKDAYYTV